MLNQTIEKGFTLIELLVVISIIGILSAGVIASLQDARNNTRDTAIIQMTKQLGQTMELQKINDGTYYLPVTTGQGSDFFVTGANTCTTTNFGTGSQAAKLRELCQGIANSITYTSNSSDPFSFFMWWGVDDTLFSNTDNYSFGVRLNSGDLFCVGSSGSTYRGPENANWDFKGCWGNP